ncbi:hypothetical protein PanWU01x14_330370 [Parasponia andersonii]|uniref:NUA/TPR/MLP1-2-like domain-containing protein n=1 Tax=Parasponia andersonii TaxID=3476 RepID=A0A2P5AI33_PARAD|nr:hypothetical protein PanWU01x14_330370 [Parasponia andersonii]
MFCSLTNRVYYVILRSKPFWPFKIGAFNGGSFGTDIKNNTFYNSSTRTAVKGTIFNGTCNNDNFWDSLWIFWQDNGTSIVPFGMITNSDAEKVISERILTLKDINGLVKQNFQLRSVVRSLSAHI